ncbi:MAG: hypothetical protein IJV72_02820 [Clostridia bacterium]|nr:hypothetical protein [Clostridia bacterium]
MKKVLALILVIIILASTMAMFSVSAESPQVDEIEGVTNKKSVYSIDFRNISSDSQLLSAGWHNTGTGSIIEYTYDGMYFNTSETSHLILDRVAFNSEENFIVDYTMKLASDVWIHTASAAYSSYDYVPSSGEWSNMESNCTFKFRGVMYQEHSVDDYTYYTDDSCTTSLGDGSGLTTLLANCESIRIRLLFEKGTSRYAYINIGTNSYFLKKGSPIYINSGYFGFSHIGTARDYRGIILENFSVYTYDLSSVGTSQENGSSTDQKPQTTGETPFITPNTTAVTEATKSTLKQIDLSGCVGSVSATLPALVAFSVLGCAVSFKRKKR